MVGTVLGHYRIIEKIGAGGMGVVYRARDERLDRDVALKVLPPGALADETARRRFRKEALALSQLNHPNIATVHDFDTQGDTDFLIMELIPGATVGEKLASGPLAERETLRLGAQLAEGLAAAHTASVLHRDLKPANLRVTPDGRLKILDFGLAKLLRPVGEVAATETATETQALAGTLPYMAPEQLRSEAVDARTDIYAAGAVLYEMATGRRPFTESQGPRLVDSILHQAPPLPSTLNPRVSPGLENIILKCLDKDPGRRYQSARELAVDLERLSTPSAAISVEATTEPRGSRRHGLGWGVAAAIALLGLLAAAVAGLNLGGWRDRLLGRAGAPRIESLAVLPLENLSGDPQQDYFADGMTEALIADLAKIGALRVISRTSVMQYKGTRKPLPQIARELNVDAVIEGSVLRSGDRVRITAQLIQGSTDRHMWAENYERDLRDILALQGEVARAIAGEIRIQLTPQEQTRLAAVRPVNPEAHDAYLKGLYYYNKRAEEDLEKSREYFRQAIEKDPNYAPAYAKLAQAGGGKAAALEALQKDDTLSEAHAVVGFASLLDWDFPAAERELRRALALNSNDATAHHYYSHYLISMGRIQESLPEAQKALELDPLVVIMNEHLGWHYFFAHQYEDSVAAYRKTLEMAPNFIYGHIMFGRAYTQSGMFVEAEAELQKALTLSHGMQGRGELGILYAASGKRGEALNILGQLKSDSKANPYEVAVLCAALGDKEQAFTWLERAYAAHSQFQNVSLKSEPALDPLRPDPRFNDLLRRIGLPL